jgi:hypothetical protein
LERPYLPTLPKFNALIDTGATTTMITSRVAAAIGLRAVNRLSYHGLDGPSWRPGHLFHLAFLAGVIQEVDLVQDQGMPMDRLLVCAKVINGGEITNTPSFDVLIGMDIISTGTLTVSKGGSFSFDF